MKSLVDSFFLSKEVPNVVLFIGKREFVNVSLAKDFAKMVMAEGDHARVELLLHPDFRIYVPEGKGNLHTVESMKRFVIDLGYPSFESKSNIFVICDADKMSESASNAILKSLEEISSNAYVLLLCQDKDKILPTILSRCRQIEVGINNLIVDDIKNYFIKLVLGSFGKSYHTVFKLLDNVENLFYVNGNLDEERVESFFDLVLYWYRDLVGVLSGIGCEELYFKEFKELLNLHVSVCEFVRFEDVVDVVEEAWSSLLLNIKFRNIILDIFLRFF